MDFIRGSCSVFKPEIMEARRTQFTIPSMSKTISLQQLDRVKSTYGATEKSIDFSSPEAVTREYNAMLANCVSLPDLGLMTE